MCKPKPRHPSNPFVGRWKVMSLYCNVHDQGWTLFKVYGHKSFVWEFEQTEKVAFPSGNVFYGGKLRELIRKHEPEEAEYSYSTNDKRLYIDRSDVEDDGFVNVCINDKYRVERIDKNDMWIYDLKDVDDEPQDYRFKMKIRRLADG